MIHYSLSNFQAEVYGIRLRFGSISGLANVLEQIPILLQSIRLKCRKKVLTLNENLCRCGISFLFGESTHKNKKLLTMFTSTAL